METLKRRVQKKTRKQFVFDKYDYYQKAVQSPATDVEFIRRVYREINKKDPIQLREDFCGTFLICTEWVKLGKKMKAYGVDLDPEPLAYGREHYLPKLPVHAQKRISIEEKNVLDLDHPKSDVTIAFNFSYFLFQKRWELKSYFQRAQQGLNPKGIFIIDVFGGTLCTEPNEETKKVKNFTYYWDQESYDPVTHRAQFHIHFKPQGQKKIERVFSYDWRMWGLAELRDLLLESGFSRTHVYWEGTNRRGEGNGVFTRTEKGEPCQSWIAYIVAERD